MFQQRVSGGMRAGLKRKPSDFQQMTAEINNVAAGLVAGGFGYSGAWVTGSALHD
jgi:hypothetical protein